MAGNNDITEAFQFKFNTRVEGWRL